MINAMSDLETDAATNEINAAKASPWPPDMRDQIWSDRLLLRFRMKKDMSKYRAFLEGVAVKGGDLGKEEVDIKGAIAPLHQFCRDELSHKELRQIFQLPRSELTEVLKSKYKICSAYAVVFCAVAEQVANFKLSRYPVDARHSPGDDDSEEMFEKELKFEKVGPGFCLDVVNDDVLLVFLQRMVSLAGPTLLTRAAKTSHDDDEGSGSDKDGGETPEESDSNTPSFRSDRRVVRLMIARYWADRLIEKYDEV